VTNSNVHNQYRTQNSGASRNRLPSLLVTYQLKKTLIFVFAGEIWLGDTAISKCKLINI